MIKRMYETREEAGYVLAEKLKQYKGGNAVVLAIPRGGVPVGFVIAKELHLPLQVCLAKKIGHPHSSEYAIGAVTLHGTVVDEKVKQQYPEYIKTETARILNELKERYKLFMGDRREFSIAGKVVILTDDGVATGKTMISSIRALKSGDPQKIVVAVPVAPPQTASRLQKEADELICPYIPADFIGVGQFYESFHQVSDDEVRDLLKNAESDYSVI